MLTKAPKRHFYPLSFQQKRMLTNSDHSILDQYILPSRIDIYKNVHLETLNWAYNYLLRTNRYFSVKFNFEEEEARLEIGDSVTDQIKFVDYSNLTKEEAEQARDEYCEEHEEPITLTELPLCKLHIIKIASDSYTLYAVFHHLMADAQSTQLFFQNLSTVYQLKESDQSIVENPQEIDYVDYCYWQQSMWEDKFFKKQESYWMSKLQPKPEQIEILNDHPEVVLESVERISYFIKLDSDLARNIAMYCKKNGLMPITFFLGIYFLAISKWSGKEDQSVVTVFKGRHEASILKTVYGLFTHLVLLRHHLQRELPVATIFKKIQKEVLQTYKNQDFPHLLFGRNLTRFSNYAFNFFIKKGFETLSSEVYEKEAWEIHHDHGEMYLMTFIVHVDSIIRLQIHYPPSKFGKERIKQMGLEMEELIRSICSGYIDSVDTYLVSSN